MPQFRKLLTFSFILLALLSSGCGGITREVVEFKRELATKVEALARIDQENEKFKGRIAQLEAENLRLKSHASQETECRRATALKREALREGGTEAAMTVKTLVPELQHNQHGGRSVASEHGTPAEVDDEEVTILSAPPRKVLEEAQKAFEQKEFDRAARGFIALANHRENRIYVTAQVHFLAAVSLYELQNYKKAVEFFERSYTLARESMNQHAEVKKEAERSPASHGKDDIIYAPRALSWMALCHKKLGHDGEARSYIQKLINEYPHSAEAARFR